MVSLVGNRLLADCLATRPCFQPTRRAPVACKCRAQQTQGVCDRGIFRILDLGTYFPGANEGDRACLEALYDIRAQPAELMVPAPLAAKYGGDAGRRQQQILSVTHRYLLAQTLFNEERTRKPQSFLEASDVLEELTAASAATACDFCDWEAFTAEDTWGRMETPHVVSASNLFKAHGLHGLLLFKHHDPLVFSRVQLADMLAVAAAWFAEARRSRPAAIHPLLLWNCLPRSGASQFHGHTQTMLSDYPFPEGEKHRKARAEYSTAGELLTDDLRAHRALGLLRSFGDMEDPTYVYPAICPYKDMETVLVAPGGLTSKSFSAALHAVMRTLIDRLGVRTFNVAAQGFEVQRAESTGDAGGGSGEGASDWAWHEGPIDTHTPGGSVLVARVVSRGKLQSRASDFGALEVLAGSSIGHTDPFIVVDALDAYVSAHPDIQYDFSVAQQEHR